MTDHDWDVHQGKRLIGTCDIDMDLIQARLIAGKAQYRASLSNKSGIAVYHEHLLRTMVVDQLIINRDDPDAPMQVRKTRPGKVRKTRLTLEAVNNVPATFLKLSAPSVTYKSERMDASAQQWIKEQVEAACPIPSKPHVSVTPEATFKRIIVFRNTCTVPTKDRMRGLTDQLAPEFAVIADALSVDPGETWVMQHRDTGLIINHRPPVLRPALSAYRRAMIEAGRESMLERYEDQEPSRLDIRPYVLDEEAERAALAAYGD